MKMRHFTSGKNGSRTFVAISDTNCEMATPSHSPKETPLPALLCILSACIIFFVLRSTPGLVQHIDSFHWTPTQARSFIWFPILMVLLWGLSIYTIRCTAFGKSLPAMRSKTFEIIHNGALTCFSILCIIGILFGARQRAQEDRGAISGLFCSVRVGHGKVDSMWDGQLGFWTYLYFLSKSWELADTIILVLRKKKPIVLQLWHHGVMPFITLSWFAAPWIEGGWWCVLVNSVIHSFMYYYYLQSVRGVRVWWKRYLTSLQIVQFCTGMAVCLFWAATKYNLADLGQTKGCGGAAAGALISIGVNGSFLSMFASFYAKTYSLKNRKQT